jgi:large subunit ribosomal protein L13
VKQARIHKTFVAKPADIERDWYVVDATDLTLGRLATQVASVLRGKHKPQYTPYEDVGDFVVVINAEKIQVTGRKLDQKMYYRHTGYPGGIKSISLRKQLQKHPERVIEHAVKGMLPRGPLGRRQFKKLKVYAGPEHPHQAQLPKPMPIAEMAEKE